ncbi:MAG: bactofilin family protein [Campylobacterota bacterium]
MGFFTKSGEACDENGTTIITCGTKIRGDIEQKCKMHIDGTFEGQLRSDSEVTIDKNGKVEGELIANRVIVSGEVNGSIKAQTVDILPGGVVNGEVEAINLIIEPKGIFEGSSKVMREVVASQNKEATNVKEIKKVASKEQKLDAAK